MKIALALACALHLGLILGVTFERGGTPSYAPQIDVTLATRPSHSAPDEARHIAQSNQLGSTESAELPPASAAQAGRAAAAPGQRGERSPEEHTESRLTTRSDSRLSASEAQRLEQEAALAGVSPEVDQLSQELADLQARLDRQNQAYSDLPRVRRLTSVAARESADAAYLQAWRQRIESVGNKYYPEASVRYGIYGSLRLLVVIRYDGRLEDIRVLSSSGFAVLDEAALKIVRMAAPFAPFPGELRATADRVEIIRTWQFQENRLSSG